MTVTLETPAGELPLQGNPQWKLTAGSKPPKLLVSAITHAAARELFAFQENGEAVLKVESNGQWTEIFRGRVKSLRRRGREVEIKAICAAGALHEVELTRTFAPAARSWSAISELPGLRVAFPEVQGLELLSAVVPLVTQFQETNWRFLQRMAWLSGRLLVYSRGAARVIALTGGPSRELQAEEVLPDTEEWGTEMTAAIVGSNSWNPATGEMPEQLTRVSADLTGLAAAGLRAGRDFLPDASNDFPLFLPSNCSLLEWATRQAAAASAKAFVWKGGVLDTSLEPGDLVTLPPEFELTRPLRIVKRKLRRAAELPGNPLLNMITLRAGTLPPPPAKSGLQLLTARVVHSQDAEKLGMSAIRLLSQQPGEQVFACSPQAMSGSFAQPLVGDWVWVLFAPQTITPPVILGSLFRGDAPAPAENGSDVLVWRLPEGLFLRFDRRNRTIELGIDNADGPPILLQLTPEHIRILGNLQLANNLIFEPKR